jgi:hypothetical protein
MAIVERAAADPGAQKRLLAVAGGVDTRPWPHLIIDDFLPPGVLAAALFEIGQKDYEFGIESRGSGRIEFSVLESEAMWRAVYSRRTMGILSEAFGVPLTLNTHNMVQLRRMNDETPAFPVHNDSDAEADTVAAFLYISDGWTRRRGGRLLLYATKGHVRPTRAIAPLQNRLVAFRTRPDHWHSVERVRAWKRLSVLSLWDVVSDASEEPAAALGASSV